MNSNIKGNIALAEAISYFTKQKYIVSIPLNDSQCYDLIVEKNGILRTVQVKYTSELKREDVYVGTLITTSGTTGKKMYSIVDTFVDLIFFHTDKDINFLIPVRDIKTNKSISLFTTEESVNKRAKINTYNYIV